jgi:hypothetical protein
MIKIGDLIVMKQAGYLADVEIKKNTITGVVVGTTLEDQKEPHAEDYWIRVVFLDGTKSTLFHDEVDVLTKIMKEND